MSMNSSILQIWGHLPNRERILTILTLVFLWGGIAAAYLFSSLQLITTPDGFFWGCIAGSVTLSYLAYIKPKMDIVSLLTPVYAIIIFLGLEMPPTMITQLLYAGSLSVLLVRLHMRFSS